MEIVIAALLFPALYFALLGWGGLLEKLCYHRSLGSDPYTIGLGLLVVLGLGALLNYSSLLLPLSFDVIIGLGLLLVIIQFIRANRFRIKWTDIGNMLPIAVALTTAVFFGWTVLPGSAFNAHDDLIKYLPRAVRMLQTGTLGGDAFDLIGIDGLGMQTYLQGFFIAHLPVTFINAFDAIFCLFLAALLLDGVGKVANIHWSLRTLAVLGFLVMNPQYVNISPLYSGIVMMLSLTLATVFFGQVIEREAGPLAIRSALPIGLFASAIAGLKVTLIPFAVGFPLLLLILLVMHKSVRWKALRPAFGSAVAGLLFYAAWMSPSAGKFFRLLLTFGRRLEAGLSQLTSSPPVGGRSYFHEVIQYGELFYGGHIYHYLAFFLLAMAIAVVAVAKFYLRRTSIQLALTASTLGLACILSTIGIFIGVYGMHVDGFVRYNAPVLIATLPAVTLLAFAPRRATDHPTLLAKTNPIWVLGIIATLFVPVAVQGTQWLNRANQALGQGHLLAYPVNEVLLRELEGIFTPGLAKYVQDVQTLAPAGATIMAWTQLSVHMDFMRNQVFMLNDPGYFRDIENVETTLRAEWLRGKLREAGVDFVIWWDDDNGPNWGEKYKPSIDRAMLSLSRGHRLLPLRSGLVVFETADH